MSEQGWMPPPSPDPNAILHEAWADTHAGRYAVALAKHEWFHREALGIRPALYGVRLSFALSYWHELASLYAPALVALQRTRDEAAEAIFREAFEQSKVEAFRDLAALNKQLGENGRTVELFLLVETKDPDLARQLFSDARNALVGAKEFAVCSRHLNLEADWAQLWELYQGQVAYARENPRPEQRQFAEDYLTHEATTLIALAVVAGRKDEASRLAEEARRKWEAPAFGVAIDKALQGEVPEPWP
jgi:hypothetical protein